MPLPIRTPRLLMRPFENDDAETFAAYRSDPEVARYQSWTAPYPLARAQEFVKHFESAPVGVPGEWYQIALSLGDSAPLIGDCAFHLLKDDARQAEIGFSLARAYWGRGYATEAVGALVDFLFTEFSLHRIIAICDVRNQGSYTLLERLGMRREAHHVDHVWFKGDWSSEYVYALLRREWQAQQASSSFSIT